ncbi:serine protease [Akkermansiaceae bacterium]|nr:serine protease [Akkermansiaceae bacterium]
MIPRALLSATLLVVAATVSFGDAIPADLLGGLSSEEFQVREKAQEDLLGWAREKPDVRAASLADLPKNEDPEIRKRSHEILRALSDDDYMTEGQGYLGIMMGEEILNGAAGEKPAAAIRISYVMKESPASAAGLKVGDLILSLDGKSWPAEGALDAFMQSVAAKKPLVNVVLKVRRGAGEPIEITVKLGKRPVPDLRDATGDLQLLDKRAREEHFGAWLERLQ